MEPLQILAIPGSLRASSHNRALLRAAEELADDGVVVTHADLRGIPVYDEDREAADAGGPDLARLRTAVAAADAVLFSTPEYNQSIPGVLKNAIDWLSRPLPDRVLQAKPVAVVGVTTGPWGTRYAQQALRHVLGATGCLVMTSPMLFLRDADGIFDGQALVDDATRGQLRDVVASLATWARTVAPQALPA